VALVAGVLSAEEIRDVNTRYHDVAAGDYDAKWGIDFGELGREQVLAKVARALGGPLPCFERALEIGAGTGYFTLNLLAAGVIEQATCVDISPGMLAALRANAEGLGLAVTTVRADAESLPFADASFDLVLGHAVLHHLPHLARAFAEFARVLSPGGVVLFAGEPSRCGNRVAALPKRAAGTLAPLWRLAVGAGPAAKGARQEPDARLESVVDVHSFTPAQLQRAAARAGFEGIHISGEELLANWFGWINRTLEASAEPQEVPWLWRQYAYHGYLLLQRLDRALLEPRLPAALFYNLMLRARVAR
jgi:SAM-dependent methyltransferase